MEEDVEIEMLLKSNEKFLEAAKEETNILQSKDIDQSSKHTLSSVVNTRSSQNKKTITENIICDHEGTLCQVIETSEKPENTSSHANKDNENILCSQDDTNCEFNKTLEKINYTSSIDEVDLQEGADDQVNQHVLELISKHPVKYYKSHHISYTSQFEEEQEYSCSDDDDDDDDNDDFRYRDNDFIDDTLEASQSKAPVLQRSQLGALQGSEVKGITLLTSYSENAWNRNKCLTELCNLLEQLIQRNKDRREELQDALVERTIEQTDKSKASGNQYIYSRCPCKKFGAPYFKDYRGFHICPPNADHQKKLENGELMADLLPRAVTWSNSNKEAMARAIKKTLISENSVRLSKEIDKLKIMLQESVNITKHNSGKLQNKISEKQHELRALSKKSFRELVESESEDREYDWMKYSVTVFNGLHSPDECRRFWHLYLKPGINKGAWSDVEDSRLIEIAENNEHQDWVSIAEELGTNRSAFQCFIHFRARLQEGSDLANGKWSTVEDNKLLTVIDSSKIGSYIPWTKIICHVGNRNHNQVYKKWSHSLNPELVKGRFSKEEDLLIVAGIEIFGVTYKDLALVMNNRNSSQISERYERYLLPKTAKVGHWTLDEDEKLLKLVQKYGTRNWLQISNEMKTRTRTQVRQRHSFIQKMKKKKPGWTVAQVKRRDFKFGKNENELYKDLESIRSHIARIKNFSPLSDIKKDALIEKLAELRDKIYSKDFSKKGRKKKEIYTGSQVDCSILDFYKSCYTKSLTKSDKPYREDDDDDELNYKLNEMLFMSNFLGHSIELPKSEEEIDNPRLAHTNKHFHRQLLNRDPVTFPSTSMPEQQIPSMDIKTGESGSTNQIDYTVPEQDDTIIMKEWWHAPPVNVAKLNFSEFFKRTVFDYSSGMHRDIWDAKVKRCQVANTSHVYSLNEQEEHVQPQKYVFPPNVAVTLAQRCALLNQPGLKRQFTDSEFVDRIKNDPFKKEEEEEEERFFDGDVTLPETETATEIYNQFEDTISTIFTWPVFLSDKKFGTLPLDDVQCLKKYTVRPRKSNNKRRKDSEINELTDSSRIPKKTLQEKSEEKTLMGGLSSKDQAMVMMKDVSHVGLKKTSESEHLRKKRKFDADSPGTLKKTHKCQKK